MTEQKAKKLQMVITALGEDKPGLVSELSQTVLECGCDVVDSRMIALAGQFAVILQISGSWDAVAKLESQLKTAERQLGMTLVCQRASDKPAKENLLPYTVEVVALDHPGIVNNLANFFSSQGINIEELVTRTYSAAHTGTQMFSVRIEVDIPSTISISPLRERFLDFCNELNLDAALEPHTR